MKVCRISLGSYNKITLGLRSQQDYVQYWNEHYCCIGCRRPPDRYIFLWEENQVIFFCDDCYRKDLLAQGIGCEGLAEYGLQKGVWPTIKTKDNLEMLL
jgi:hypothetical protein